MRTRALRTALTQAIVITATVAGTPALACAQANTELQVTHVTGETRALSPAAIAALPRQSGQVLFHGDTVRYAGVALRDVLRAAGVVADSLRGQQLRLVVLIEAVDGYAVALALSDVDPSIGGRRAVLVDREDGAPLPNDRGPYRLIIEGDARPSRWARQVVRIRIVEPR